MIPVSVSFVFLFFFFLLPSPSHLTVSHCSLHGGFSIVSHEALLYIKVTERMVFLLQAKKKSLNLGMIYEVGWDIWLSFARKNIEHFKENEPCDIGSISRAVLYPSQWQQ